MTPTFCCGFECGLLTSNSAHWGSANNASISTTTIRNGARSLRLNLSASTQACFVASNHTPGGTVAVMRAYVNFTTLPSTDFFIAGLNVSSTGIGVLFKASDSKLYAGRDNGGTLSFGATGVSVTTGQWYLLDILVDVHANPWTIDAKINGTSVGQATVSVAASTIGPVQLGRSSSGTSTTVDLFVDDVLFSATSGDYPLGAGYVNHFVPTSDGTHNIAGTGDFQRTLTGTDILNATTTAFQLVDEIPLEATVTDWINMLAPPNATDYVECVFGPAPGISTPTAAPRGVEVICGINQAGTGAGNMEIRLNDNGTTGVVYTATAVAGVATASGQQFKRAHFADPPSAATVWTLSGNGNFNNLKIRFGSPAALDVNPDQYFGCAMIEAEFAEVTATPLTQTAADDANNLADALTKQLNGSLTQTGADTLTTPTDAMVLGLGLVFAESITVATDGLVVGHGMAFTDNANNLADALNKTIGYSVLLGDNANTLADGEVRQLGTTQTLADTLASLADAYAQLLVYLLALSDTQAANWADAHQLLLAHFLALADTLQPLTDTTVIRLEQRVDFTDTLNPLSDVMASQLGTVLELTDSITVLTDAYLQVEGQLETFADTLTTPTDSLALGYGLLFSDTAQALTDALTMRAIGLLVFSDTLTLTDAEAQVMEHRLTFTDAITLTDSATLGYGLILSDSYTLADSVTIDIQDTIVGTTETASDTLTALTDSLTLGIGLLVTDTAQALTDTTTLSMGQQVAIADVLAITDNAALLLVHLLNVSDDSNFIADFIQTNAPQGPQIQVGVTDALATFSDSVSLRLGYQIALSDNAANWADSVAVALGLGVILADNGVVLSDSLAALLSHLLRLSDSFTLTDALTTFGENYLTITDSFVLTDDVDTELRGPDFNYQFDDTLALTDAIALSLANELQLQLTLTDAITLTDHYFDLRRPYASSAKRHIVVPSPTRVTTPTTSRVVVVPAKNRSTEVQ